MNRRIEDLIRSSARAQGDRYRAEGDLVARVTHRRRQRAARRVAATGAAAGVLMVGAALLLTGPLGDADRTVPRAVATTPAEIVDTTAPAETVSSVTTPGPTTTPGPDTTVAPTAPPTTLHPSTPPAYAPQGGTFWPFGAFWDVPKLGDEGVRGTGCGARGDLGPTIPDGLWSAFVAGHSADIVNVDLACIYAVPSAESLSQPSLNVVLDEPQYVIVNNTTQVRPTPMDPQIKLYLADRNETGECVYSRETGLWDDIPPDRQVWLRIHNGSVTWVFAGCPPP